MEDEPADKASTLQKICAGCTASSPRVDGEFALIREGWRLTRSRGGADRMTMVWWCPACFERRRERMSE